MEKDQVNTTTTTTTNTEREEVADDDEDRLTLTYTHVTSSKNIYLLSLRLPRTLLKENNAFKTRITFICDCSSSMGTCYKQILIPSIKNFYERVESFDCSVVLFGKDITKYNVKQPADFTVIESKALENQTNIEGGITTAVNEAIEFYHNAKDRNYTQIFFFASDGEHNSTSKESLANSIIQNGKNIHAAEIQALFLVVGIGAHSNTTFGMKAKEAIQTITSSGELPIHYAKQHSDLLQTMQELVTEQLLAIRCKVVNLSYPKSNEQTGLMKNFISKPVSKITKLISAEFLYTLFRSDSCPTDADTFLLQADTLEISLKAEKQEFLETLPVIGLVHETISEIAIMGITSTNSESVCESISSLDPIIQILKDRQYVSHVKSAKDRIQMMRDIRSGVTELQHGLNELKDKVRFISNATNAEKAQFLRKAADMKHGNRALRRGNVADSKDIFSNTKEIFQDYKFNREEIENDRVSILSTASESEHYQMCSDWVKTAKPEQGPELDVIEMLYGYGAIGYLIRVSRKSASDVDPWTINVAYISSDLADTASAACALSANSTFTDLAKQPVQDVLVVVNPKNEVPGKRFLTCKLYQTYNSLVFTRNLDVAIPRGQKYALLMHSMVRCVSQFFESAEMRTLKHFKIFRDILYTLDTTSSFGSDFWMQMNRNLLSENPAMYLTATQRDEVQSISQVLVLLCVKPQDVIISVDAADVAKWELIKLSILCETTAREMRIYAQKCKQIDDTSKLCRKMMGISDESCFNTTPLDEPEPEYQDKDHSSEYSAESIVEIASLFNKSRRIGDVSRVLTFIEIWQKCFFGESKYTIGSFKTQPEEEMDEFFAKLRDKILPAIDSPCASTIPPIVKAAMIVQGLMNPDSKQRKDGLPPVYTALLAQDQLITCVSNLRKAVYKDRLAEKVKILTMQEAAKREKELQEMRNLEQSEFMKIHAGTAQPFTQKQINELNKSRPLSDQLQITRGSHMLVHHCGYPACPYYLKNLSTEEDHRKGTNMGLWNHLKGFVYPQNCLINGFHSQCFTVLRANPNISKEKYVEQMLKEFKFKIKSSTISVEDTTQSVEEVWEIWNKWNKTDKS